MVIGEGDGLGIVVQASGALHGEPLVRALTEVAVLVQQTRTVADLLRVAGAGLDAIGFKLGVTERAALAADSPLLSVLESNEPALVDAAPLFPAGGGTAADGARPQAAAVGVQVRGRPWGVMTLFQKGLRADDLPPLRLFSLQLASALEVAQAIEHLERRTSELSLVHQLTVSGSRGDTPELTRRALEAVCRTTRSDAGVLHRFDEVKGLFTMVGEVLGYQGLLSERYRSFAPIPGNPMLTAPRALGVEALDEEGVALAAAGFRHFSTVPLFLESNMVGLLSLARKRDEPYSAPELQSAEILGVQMASFLERTRLYDDLKKSYDELARAQSELVRHERLAALGELAAVMAHEVRNPLGVVFNSLTTLKRLLRPTGDAEMLLNIVGEEAERLNRIVGDLLDFVRPYELVKKHIAVGPVILGAVDAALKSLGSSGVRVETDIAADLPPFAVDGQLVRQALVNLVINAAQAMPKGGTVTLRARAEPATGAGRTGPALVIEVQDEGVGINATSAQKIFQPFFTTKATGTGLGLAVVKRIVEAHQGEVHAQPNAGPGATFVLRLPSEGRPAATTSPPSSGLENQG